MMSEEKETPQPLLQYIDTPSDVIKVVSNSVPGGWGGKGCGGYIAVINDETNICRHPKTLYSYVFYKHLILQPQALMGSCFFFFFVCFIFHCFHCFPVDIKTWFQEFTQEHHWDHGGTPIHSKCVQIGCWLLWVAQIYPPSWNHQHFIFSLNNTVWVYCIHNTL